MVCEKSLKVTENGRNVWLCITYLFILLLNKKIPFVVWDENEALFPQNSSTAGYWNMKNKVWRSLPCSFLYSPVTFSLLNPNILLITLFSDTVNLCSILRMGDQVLRHHILEIIIELMNKKTVQETRLHMHTNSLSSHIRHENFESVSLPELQLPMFLLHLIYYTFWRTTLIIGFAHCNASTCGLNCRYTRLEASIMCRQ